VTYKILRPGEGATLADAHAVRRAVFVEEQGVPESLEMDGLDDRASQFVAYRVPEADDSDEDPDSPGRPIGTARLRVSREGKGKPERVAVREAHRGNGLGRALMEAVEAAAVELDCSVLELHAQTAVEEFYADLGYETVSDEFEEAGIPHVRMRKEV